MSYEGAHDRRKSNQDRRKSEDPAGKIAALLNDIVAGQLDKTRVYEGLDVTNKALEAVASRLEHIGARIENIERHLKLGR